MSEQWLIDANAVFEFLTEQKVKERGVQSKAFNRALDIARSAVRNPSAIQPIDPEKLPIVKDMREKLANSEPVRHGHWNEITDENGCRDFVCTACNKSVYDSVPSVFVRYLPKCCPFCGAKMGGKETEQ